jgi:HSP20 family molecular chaperone IbpA
MSTLSIRRDPFFAEFDRLVRSAFGPSVSTGNGGSTSFSPAAELHRDGNDAVIRLELPGVSTDDITVEVRGRDLVVSGSRRDEHTEEESGRRFSEFRYGSFTRSFRLAPNVTADAVSASYDAGVLTVRVADAYAETERHKVEITSGTPVQVEQKQVEQKQVEQKQVEQVEGGQSQEG